MEQNVYCANRFFISLKLFLLVFFIVSSFSSFALAQVLPESIDIGIIEYVQRSSGGGTNFGLPIKCTLTGAFHFLRTDDTWCPGSGVGHHTYSMDYFLISDCGDEVNSYYFFDGVNRSVTYPFMWSPLGDIQGGSNILAPYSFWNFDNTQEKAFRSQITCVSESRCFLKPAIDEFPHVTMCFNPSLWNNYSAGSEYRKLRFFLNPAHSFAGYPWLPGVATPHPDLNQYDQISPGVNYHPGNQMSGVVRDHLYHFVVDGGIQTVPSEFYHDYITTFPREIHFNNLEYPQRATGYVDENYTDGTNCVLDGKFEFVVASLDGCLGVDSTHALFFSYNATSTCESWNVLAHANGSYVNSMQYMSHPDVDDHLQMLFYSTYGNSGGRFYEGSSNVLCYPDLDGVIRTCNLFNSHLDMNRPESMGVSNNLFYGARDVICNRVDLWETASESDKVLKWVFPVPFKIGGSTPVFNDVRNFMLIEADGGISKNETVFMPNIRTQFSPYYPINTTMWYFSSDMGDGQPVETTTTTTTTLPPTTTTTIFQNEVGVVVVVGTPGCPGGYFVDGFCCNTPCNGICEACNIRGREGICTPIPAGTDPDNECTNFECGTGYCSGARSCQHYTSGERNCRTCMTCNGATSTSCVPLPDGSQDTQGVRLCSTLCWKCHGGLCVPQNEFEDLFNQCTGFVCDDGFIPSYYFGWENQTCYYMGDVPTSTCTGVGTCHTQSYYCPRSTKGKASPTICGCTEAQIGCEDTTPGSCNNSLCWSTPEAENVVIIPSPSVETKDLKCTYIFVDPWGQEENTSNRNFKWYLNETLKPELDDYEIIDVGNVSVWDRWRCAVSVANLHNKSGYFTSPLLVIGDDVPPYIVSEPYITSLQQCSDRGAGRVHITIADYGSEIGKAFIEVSTQLDTYNMSMSCTLTNPSNCSRVMSGFSQNFTTNRIYFSDSSNNWDYVIFNNTIDVINCGVIYGSGGGGGDFEREYFKLHPRELTERGEHPSDALIIGDNSVRYTIEPIATNTYLELIVQPSFFKDSAGEMIESTSFFKTDPVGVFRIFENNISLLMFCDIPLQYRFEPYGLFNTSVIVKKEGADFQESIRVICESQEHYDGAGSLIAVLSQPIGFLNLSLGEMWFIIILGVVVASYRKNLTFART